METQPAALAEKPLEGFKASEAFLQLVEQEAENLLRLARQLLYDPEEARDLVQDALLKAYLSLGSFRWECSLKSWVVRILVNSGLKRLRRRKLSARVASWFRSDSRSPLVSGTWGPRPAATPEQEASLREQAAFLQGALEKLSPKQRVVLLLRYLEEMSVQQIADTLDIGPGTVKTHLVRAVRQIRRANIRLQREVGDEDL